MGRYLLMPRWGGDISLCPVNDRIREKNSSEVGKIKGLPWKKSGQEQSRGENNGSCLLCVRPSGAGAIWYFRYWQTVSRRLYYFPCAGLEGSEDGGSKIGLGSERKVTSHRPQMIAKMDKEMRAVEARGERKRKRQRGRGGFKKNTLFLGRKTGGESSALRPLDSFYKERKDQRLMGALLRVLKTRD